ncbi:hypothetical protein [Streptomyces sp. NPDC057686]|uniref:hypothetical protein n=1 Tax=Streptomyces sp. NPDC057686 TaxID=3346212 RepID=UPI003685C263
MGASAGKTPPVASLYRALANLRPGVALRQAALAAGIRPEAVYHRRRADQAFAHRTDQQRTTR